MSEYPQARATSSKEVQKVKKVQFGILSEQDILRFSVCEVNSTLLYDKETSLPAEHGLNDPRMGVTMRGLVCQTCFGDMKECPGHFGHIKLAEVVYNPEFLVAGHKVLKSVCFNCSKLLIAPDRLPSILEIKNNKKRLSEISKSMTRVCSEEGGCGRTQPRYQKRKMDILVRREGVELSEEDSKRVLRASEVYEIFSRIDDETVKILGLHPIFSRPEYMLIKLLVVAPPIVRPSIELTSSARSEDDLTHLYQSILSTNIELIKAKESGQPRTRIDEILDRLQAYCGYLMNNDENKAKQKGGRPIKSISQRLKGKEGRLRGNLMGKRVDYSARTVVSPDPSLELDQLGVPLQIAQELTIPETVTQLNIDFLKALVERGDEWPGARYYLSKANNEVIDLNFVKSKPNLQYGDVVERHLMDNDYVLFNRQPSLHKMSIMSHRVKVLPFSTFRLNLAVTTPYNADFDGDEMNMHVPQNLETKAEAKHLIHVPKQIITPQSNRPVMGLNQDVLLGIRLFTLRDTFVEQFQLNDLLMVMENWDGTLPKPAILKPKPLWTGKQVLSFIIPKTNYIRVSDSDNKDFHFNENSIIIRRGELVVGAVNKSVVGNTKGSLLGCIWIDYGPEKTREFLSYSQKLINSWLLYNGFTVGIADTIVPVNILKTIEDKRMEAKLNFMKVLQDTQKEHKKLIVHQPGKTIIESFEHKVNTLLNDCRSEIGKLLNDSVGPENNIKNMILAGSKGNNLNISQISGMVGQQNVEGKRIPFGLVKRTLPHFVKDDFGPESRGFVANSYYKGLTPEEFFFHTMGGREGLIDTAVKTAQTGYMQRRLVKALEDVMVQYDYSVRDTHGNLIQYLYGEDGIAGEFIEEQKFDLLELSDSTLMKRCCFYDIEEKTGFEDSVQKYYEEGRITQGVRESLFNNSERAIKVLNEEYARLKDARDHLRTIFPPKSYIGILPVNLDRLLSHSQFHSDTNESDLDPVEAVERLRETIDRLRVVYIEKDNDLKSFSENRNDYALLLFRSFVIYKFCSKKVILELRLSKKAYNYLLREVEAAFNKSLAHPGEMTGSIAAQSIGETLTQMTLNTFHFAGVSSQNITLGVPRIQEIINCSKNIKGASMTIYLEGAKRFSSEAVHDMISMLEFTTIKHIAKSTEIYFDPDINNTIIEEDQELIFMQDEIENYSPWMLRIIIDPILMGRKGVKLRDITKKIESYLGDKQMQIIDSLETADPIILRLRLLGSSTTEFNDIKKVEQFVVEDMAIKGFCKKVSYKRQQVHGYTETGISEIGDKEGEYVLETSGTDIAKVLRLPSVDLRRSTTNDVWDIYVNFGIEASRVSLMKEIETVFSFFNIYVNSRHIGLLADTITSNGKLMSISRTGINRVYTSPFRKCSFEETVDIMTEAAVFAEIDGLKGVTENIIMGQVCKIGTGAFDILMDTNYLLPKEEEKEKVTAQWKYFPDLNPVLEIETELDEDVMSKYAQTPFVNMNTPLPLLDYTSRRTPLYDAQGMNSPQTFTPMMTPGMTPRHGFGANRVISPHHNVVYSPFLKQNYESGFNQSMSPMLPVQNQPLSPHALGSKSFTGNMLYNTSNELKYSPLSPHYNASPMRLQSPSSTKHLTNMSPGYTYNSSNSPYYSPHSNPSPGLSDDKLGDSSKMHESPFSEMSDGFTRQIYNPESPGYQQLAAQFKKKEDKYSDEES